jgi:glucokinase
MDERSPELVVGVDLGATKLAAGLVDSTGRVLALTRWPHQLRAYDDALDAVAALVHGLHGQAAEWGRHVAAAGVAAAALFDADREVLVHAPILDWHDRPLRADLAARLRLPVVAENDANAAAWGEYRHGAGAGERCLLMVTLGTGVGGGVVIDDRLLSGGFGLAAELGHVKVGAEGRSCPCGARDCLEQYASGTALRRAARTAAARDPSAAPRLLAHAGGDLERIDGPLITAAARAGDPLARRVVGDVGTWLGRGLAQMAAVLDPSLVLVGGGLAVADELILEPARRAYAALVGFHGVRPPAPLRAAALGNTAGVVGVAALARARAERGDGSRPRVRSGIRGTGPRRACPLEEEVADHGRAGAGGS